jgi:hypothetical protein
MAGMRSNFIAALFATLLLPAVCIAQPGYQPGTLLGIDKKVETTPAMWLWDTVVSSYDTMRYDLRVQVGNQLFVTEYIPEIQPNGPLPGEWTADRPINVRTDKGKMYIKLSYGREIETHILKRRGPK